ncbi:Pre-mRNA splicing factor ATP-dependent RNA helicase PRP16 [Pyrenophora tritici-repentis]|nr:Pre-mRNA splicing factor ATP-dependent RNA helicase PRP16 [Pyrenophora tritici-repentis]
MDSKRRKIEDNPDIDAHRLASRQKYLAQREAQQLAPPQTSRNGGNLQRTARHYGWPKSAKISMSILMDLLSRCRLLQQARSAHKRHKETGYEKSEVQLWEEEQTKRVAAQIKKPERVQEEDYEYVFDESTNVFDMSKITPIDLDKQRLQSTLDEAESKAKSIADVAGHYPYLRIKRSLYQPWRTIKFLFSSEKLVRERQHSDTIFGGSWIC